MFLTTLIAKDWSIRKRIPATAAGVGPSRKANHASEARLRKMPRSGSVRTQALRRRNRRRHRAHEHPVQMRASTPPSFRSRHCNRTLSATEPGLAVATAAQLDRERTPRRYAGRANSLWAESNDEEDSSESRRRHHQSPCSRPLAGATQTLPPDRPGHHFHCRAATSPHVEELPKCDKFAGSRLSSPGRGREFVARKVLLQSRRPYSSEIAYVSWMYSGGIGFLNVPFRRPSTSSGKTTASAHIVTCHFVKFTRKRNTAVGKPNMANALLQRCCLYTVTASITAVRVTEITLMSSSWPKV